MPRFARISRIIAFLRSENPVEDISKNPVVKHPHNTAKLVPERLPAAKIKELSQLEPARALTATAEEWLGIAAAIALSSYFWHPALYVIAVVFIGARQHALIIMGHDASHYRYLPTRWQNEFLANLFLMWPVFASVEGFRKFHGTHHQYTNLPDDGNRHIWHTHDAAGELAPDWQFPKTKLGLALVLLRRALFLTGMLWIVRGLVGASLIPSPHWMIAARITFYGSVAGALTIFGAWYAFLLYWIVPYCTWHIAAQYTRLICEHSAVEKRRRGICHHPHHDPDQARVDFGAAAECGLSPRASLVPERALVPIAGAAPGADGTRRLPRPRRGQALGTGLARRVRQITTRGKRVTTAVPRLQLGRLEHDRAIDRGRSRREHLGLERGGLVMHRREIGVVVDRHQP